MNPRNTFLRGFGSVMLFHLLQIPIFIACMQATQALDTAAFHLLQIPIFIAWAVFGLIQLAYVIPMALKARKFGETARLQGILTAAGLTILINGICDAALFGNFHSP